jgi:hypothetical protein
MQEHFHGNGSLETFQQTSEHKAEPSLIGGSGPPPSPPPGIWGFRKRTKVDMNLLTYLGPPLFENLTTAP